MSELQTLRTAQTGGVLHVTLNRPEARNAMSLQMVRELRQVLRTAEQGAVRVLVLRGEGGHFCAGGDLKDMAMARANDSVAQVSMAFGELCLDFAQTPLAVIAVLEGTVMGGGFGLACVADVAMASESASFRLPETSLGVVPAQIAPFLVERLGYSQAKRLAVTGGKLDAQAALRVGLVHEVVATEEMAAAVDRVVTDVLACAPGALAATKQLVARASWTPAQDLIADAAAVFAKAALGPEGQEGVTAFLQKRKPQWAVS